MVFEATNCETVILISSASRRLTGIIITYGYILAQALVGFVYVPMLLQNIGQDEYGLYQLIGSIMSYIVSINGILSAGVGRFYCKYMAEGKNDLMENTLAIARRLYWVLSVFVMLISCVLAVVVRFVYSASFTNSQLDECSAMLVVLGINTIVIMNNTISVAAITANERFVFLKGSQLAALIAQPFIVYGLTTIFKNALAVCLVVLVTNVLCAVSQRLFAKYNLHISFRYHGWDMKLAKGLLFFSGAIVLVTIADQIFWKTDQLIVGYYFGAAAVAVYSVGSQIYTIYMTIGTAASSVFLPRVSELYCQNKDMSEISDLFIKVGRISFIVCGFVLSLFIVLGKDFIIIWAGKDYIDAFYIALIVMVPFTIDLIQNLGLTIMQVANVYLYRGYMYLAIALVNVVVTIILLKLMGIVGAAVSTAIAMVIGNGFCMNWYYSEKLGLNIKKFWLEIAKLSVLVIVGTGALLLLYNLIKSLFSGLVVVLVSAIIYFFIYFFLVLMFGLNESEKTSISAFIKR